jgi:hypothetical protein
VINGKEYVMEANEWVYPPAFYTGNAPVLLQEKEEEEKEFIQLGQHRMALAQTGSRSLEQGSIAQKLKQMHRSSNRFFEDLSLDSMSSTDPADDVSQQAQQTVDISEVSQTSSFERTEIVESQLEDGKSSNQTASQKDGDSKTDETKPIKELNGKKAQCYGTLMQMDLKDGMFLVGDSFMRKFYTVFDRDNDRIGLAESVIQ